MVKVSGERGGKLRSLVEKDKFWKCTNILIIVVINLMCLGLTLYENFWYDEAYTIGMIRRDFGDIIRTTSQDVHPPLYYIILKLFYIFPGMQQLLSVKIFSWLFYFLYLTLGAYICRKHYNKRVECFWLILSGFLPIMIVQSTSPRMYTMALFFMTLGFYSGYLVVKNEKKRYWILFTIVSAISMYIHTFCMIEMFVFYGILVFWALFKKQYKILKKVLLSGVCVSLIYIPWLTTLWNQFSRWAGWESGWNSHFEEFGLSSVISWVSEWFSVLENPSPLTIICGVLIFVFTGFYAVKYVKETKDSMSYMSLIVAGIVILAAILISVLIVPCFVGRYVFPLFGGVLLFVAVGIDRIKQYWIKIVILLTVVICGTIAYVGEVELENPKGLNSYRTYMNSNLEDDDLIMADNYFLMMMSIYYPDMDYMIYGSVPACMPFADCEAFTAWEQLENEDIVWYISFADFRCGGLDEKYEVVDRQQMKFYYYDIVIEKYEKKEEAYAD